MADPKPDPKTNAAKPAPYSRVLLPIGSGLIMLTGADGAKLTQLADDISTSLGNRKPTPIPDGVDIFSDSEFFPMVPGEEG
jgi:hypothetical protein